MELDRPLKERTHRRLRPAKPAREPAKVGGIRVRERRAPSAETALHRVQCRRRKIRGPVGPIVGNDLQSLKRRLKEFGMRSAGVASESTHNLGSASRFLSHAEVSRSRVIRIDVAGAD